MQPTINYINNQPEYVPDATCEAAVKLIEALPKGFNEPIIDTVDLYGLQTGYLIKFLGSDHLYVTEEGYKFEFRSDELSLKDVIDTLIIDETARLEEYEQER